jgi:hypothetical protein
MMTVAEERTRLLRDRLESAGLKRAAAALPASSWRTHGLILQIVFFGLTCAGLAAFYFLLEELDVPQTEIITGCVALALAEYLIRARRWFGTGVEAALWIGGLFSFITALPSSGSPEKFLVLMAAAAIAGVRVRNPFFGALAAILLIVYFEEKANLGVIAAFVVAASAVIALLRTWQRPSTEWLWVLIVIAAPIAGRAQADAQWRDLTITLFLAYGLIVLAIAIRAKHHALFISGGLAIAIAATDLARLSTAPAEAQLALAGALLLGGSWLLSRALRDRTAGIVTTPASLTSFDDTFELMATANLPQQEFESASGRAQGDGGFGGAGATGSY